MPVIDKRGRPAAISVLTHHTVIPGVQHWLDPIGQYRAIEYAIHYDDGGVITAGPMFNVDPAAIIEDNNSTPPISIPGSNVVRLRNSTDTDYSYLRVKGIIVDGANTVIFHEQMQVADHIIVLNSNVTGAPTEDAGIEIERGTSQNQQLLWNEASKFWQATRINALTAATTSSEIVRYAELAWSGRVLTPHFQSFMGSEKVGDKNWDDALSYSYLGSSEHDYLNGKPETVRGTLLAIDEALTTITAGGASHNKMSIRTVDGNTPPTFGASHLLTLGTEANDQRIDFTPQTSLNKFLATRVDGSGAHVPYFRSIDIADLPTAALVPTGTARRIPVFDQDGKLRDIYTTSPGGITALLQYSAAPTVNRTYTIDIGIISSNFVMTEGDQTINGNKTFTGATVFRNTGSTVLIQKGAAATDGLIITSANTGSATRRLTITTQATTFSANRTYTLTDVSADAFFIMSQGDQTINGIKSFACPLANDRVEIGVSANVSAKPIRFFSGGSGYVDLRAPSSTSGNNTIVLPSVPVVTVATPYYVRATIAAGNLATLSLVPESEISFTSITDTKLAGQAITAGDILRMNSTGKVFKARANALTTSTIYGIAMENAVLDAPVKIMINGVYTFTADILVGLAIGANIYLSATVDGAISDAIPIASEHTLTKVGVKSATNQIRIAISEPIILA